MYCTGNGTVTVTAIVHYPTANGRSCQIWCNGRGRWPNPTALYYGIYTASEFLPGTVLVLSQLPLGNPKAKAAVVYKGVDLRSSPLAQYNI